MTAEAVVANSLATITSQDSSGPHGKRPSLSSHCPRSPRSQHATNCGGRCSTLRVQPASSPIT
eukprot:11080464-Alexandrium_andersonii.AAC.1